jgi:hypothetical protein
LQGLRLVGPSVALAEGELAAPWKSTAAGFFPWLAFFEIGTEGFRIFGGLSDLAEPPSTLELR